jgi:tryptophan synthase alpha chain
VLELVAGFRRAGCRMPIVLYLYYNLLHRHGVRQFIHDAAVAGVDGILALDLPPEEAGDYERAMRRARLCPIYLIAPTTPPARVAQICRHAAGFIYYVSREGVTGMQKQVAVNLAPMLATIRRHTKLPIAVGFGISTPAQARAVAGHGDAVVVGSAIVNQIAQGKSARAVGRFVAPMVKAVKS